VTLTVIQLDEPVDTEVYDRETFSFGLVPRDTCHTAAGSSVVGYIPHQKLFTTSSSPVDKEHTWGVGVGSAFPPGMQLELASAEVNSNYPVALLGSHSDAKASSTDSRVALRVEFTIACSTVGFGAVY